MTFYRILFLIIILKILIGFNESSAGKPLIRVPLTRVKSPFTKMLEAGVNPEDVHWQLHNNLNKNSTNDTISLYKFLDMEFYATLGFGHPLQPVNVLLDSTWGDSFVLSSSCSIFNIACAFKKKFNPELSSTFNKTDKTFNISLGSSVIPGYIGNDTLYLPHVNVTNHIFGVISTLPFSYLFSESSGILGLGFERLSAWSKPFVYSLYQQKKISVSSFSIYFNDLPETPHGGSIFFGGSDPKHRNGSFSYLRVTSPYYWQFDIKGVISIDPKKRTTILCQKDCSGIIDTSSNSIRVPKDLVSKINVDVLKGWKFMFGKYMVSCNTIRVLPHFIFTFGGKQYNITGENYIQSINVRGYQICISAFTETDLPSPYNKAWILGGAFLSQFYTEFNLATNTIGFAKKNG